MNLHTLARTAAAVVLISTASTAALAQDDNRRTVKAGADGRAEERIDGTTRLNGRPAAQVAAFRTRLDAVAAQMRAMPAVSAPPFPACSRLTTWLHRNDLEPVLAGSVDVTTPVVATPGKCEEKTELSVEISLNSLQGHLPERHAEGPDGKPWYVIQASRQGPGFIEWEWNGDKHVYLFEPRGTPFKPVTTERYARYTLDQLTSGGTFDGGEPGAMLRARMASWTPAQRQTPACVKVEMTGSLEDIMVDPVAACPPDRTVVEIDDAWFDRKRPDVIQLIALEMYHQHSMESEHSWALRSAVWSSLDREALRAHIGR
jgi:hypothetical protein